MTLGLYLLLGLLTYAAFLCWAAGKGGRLMLIGVFATLLLVLGIGMAIYDLTDLRGYAALLAMFIPGYALLTASFVSARILFH